MNRSSKSDWVSRMRARLEHGSEIHALETDKPIELTEAALAHVAGGINPQPLPPRDYE
jgi:hypothetical protein